MIDIHSHLLPGVDDGPKPVEMSHLVLRRLAADGVACVVLPPDVLASRAPFAPYERNCAILDELRGLAPRELELRPGWEIMLDKPNVDFRAPSLGLGASRAVLVEFPLLAVPVCAGEELSRIRDSGPVPVLAHPERYYGCTVERRGRLAARRCGDPDGFGWPPGQGQGIEGVAIAGSARAR